MFTSGAGRDCRHPHSDHALRLGYNAKQARVLAVMHGASSPSAAIETISVTNKLSRQVLFGVSTGVSSHAVKTQREERRHAGGESLLLHEVKRPTDIHRETKYHKPSENNPAYQTRRYRQCSLAQQIFFEI